MWLGLFSCLDLGSAIQYARMIGLKHPSIILPFLVAVAFVIVTGYVVVSGNDASSSSLEDILEREAASTSSDETVLAKDVPFELEGETQTLVSDLFTVDLPADWVSVAAKQNERIGNGTFLYGWIYNKRGEEITDDVMDGKNSVVFDQAESRLYAQMALLEKLMG